MPDRVTPRRLSRTPDHGELHRTSTSSALQYEVLVCGSLQRPFSLKTQPPFLEAPTYRVLPPVIDEEIFIDPCTQGAEDCPTTCCPTTMQNSFWK